MNYYKFLEKELKSPKNSIRSTTFPSALVLSFKWFVKSFDVSREIRCRSPEFKHFNYIFSLVLCKKTDEHGTYLLLKTDKLHPKFKNIKVYIVCGKTMELKIFSVVTGGPEEGHRIYWNNDYLHKNQSLIVVGSVLFDGDSTLELSTFNALRDPFIIPAMLQPWLQTERVSFRANHFSSPIDINFKWVISLDTFMNSQNVVDTKFEDGRTSWQIKAMLDKDGSLGIHLSAPELVITYFWNVKLVDKYCQCVNIHLEYLKDSYSAGKISSKQLENRLVPKVNIVLVFQIVAIYKDCNSKSPSTENTIPTCKKRKSSGFEKLLFKQDFADVKLIVDRREIFAHKTILIANSPVFYNIFLPRPKISQLTIKDLTVEAVESLLRFLYIGEIETYEEESLIEILAAASKYKVQDLVDIISESLERRINVKNVTDILVIASDCKIENLQNLATNFIANNLSKMDPCNYKKIGKVDPRLLIKILSETSKAGTK